MTELKQVSPEIIEYVEQEIIPRYASFDKAHQEGHVRTVLTLTLFERFPAMIVDYQWESNFEWAILGDPRLNFVNLRHVYPPQA